MRVADYVVNRIERCGVSTVYMITGRGLLYLTDAVAANKNINSISMHNEQALSYAAYAYAEQSEGMGVCMVSTGCAATNAITGVMCAWQDDVPMLVISGQHMLDETTYHTHSEIRTYGQQENNIINLVRPITKYATMVEDKDEIGRIMDEAIYEATHGRKGPVWVDIPLDIQNMRVEEDELAHFDHPSEKIEKFDVQQTINLMTNSKRPIVLVGAGIRKADAREKLVNFIESHQIPLVYNLAAADLYCDNNPLSIGPVGSMGGSRAGNIAMQNSDLILCIGCRLNTMLTGTVTKDFARSATIIRVDIDEAELKEYNFENQITIHADSKDFLTELCANSKELHFDNQEWVNKCIHWKELFPKNISNRTNIEDDIDLYEVAESIGLNMNRKGTVISDAGIEELVIPGATCAPDGVRIIHPFSQGAMGFALPAVIGAYGAGETNIICVVGDGSIMMNIQELQTIKSHNIPAKIIVINNYGYAVIRERQEELFRKRTIGTDDSNGVFLPSFEKVADCFSFRYLLINSYGELKDKIKELLDSKEATICEIMCKDDQPFLKNSYAMSSSRRLLRRPLEDQFPFLERDVIKNEMLIEPVEFE